MHIIGNFLLWLLDNIILNKLIVVHYDQTIKKHLCFTLQ